MLVLGTGCLALLVQLTLAFPGSSKLKYDGHKVLEIFHNSENDFRKLQEITLKFGLDIWKHAKHVNDSMQVRVSPEHLHTVLENLQTIGARVNTMVEDVEELLTSIEEMNKRASSAHKRQIFSPGSGFNHNVYNDFQTIMNFLRVVAEDDDRSAGVNAEFVTIGYSTEGREITLIKIYSTSGSANKRGIFFDGAIHAREWISPASVCYLIEQFAYNPDNIADIYTLLSDYDIYLLPVLNPDGYEYSRQSVRLWRKNRRVNSGSSCVGVDLNRNFPFEWNPQTGGSTDPCSDLFSGTAAGSETETQVLVNWLTNNAALFDAYITVHSYGQYWLYPWGWTSAYPDDRADLDYAAIKAAITIEELYGHRYIVGSATRVLYAAAGGSDDYAKGGAGIKYSYTIELRDTGRYGFLLPESEIQPTCEEFRAGFLAFAKAMKARSSQSSFGK